MWPVFRMSSRASPRPKREREKKLRRGAEGLGKGGPHIFHLQQGHGKRERSHVPTGKSTIKSKRENWKNADSHLVMKRMVWRPLFSNGRALLWLWWVQRKTQFQRKENRRRASWHGAGVLAHPWRDRLATGPPCSTCTQRRSQFSNFCS